jgi:hypothetical protein
MKVFRKYLKPRTGLIILLFSISILSKLYLINLGVYGVLNTLNEINIDNPFINIINIFSISTTLLIFILYLKYFQSGGKWIPFLMIIDFVFSVLSGFKSAILFSVISFVLARFLVLKKINVSNIFIFILLIFLSYKIIDPFRLFIQRSNVELNSAMSLVSALNESLTQDEFTNGIEISSFLKRLNFLPEIVKFIEYKNEGFLNDSDPDFFKLILLSPISTVVPRFLWQEKPKADLGKVWVNYNVFQDSLNSSRAFGPIGFLYLSGGAVMIFIGFFLIGFMLRFINILLESEFWGAKILSLILMYSTINFEAQFDMLIVTLFQTFIIGILFQLIFLRSEN